MDPGDETMIKDEEALGEEETLDDLYKSFSGEREFHVLDDLDQEENGDEDDEDAEREEGEDSSCSDADYDIGEEEIDAMLDEGLSLIIILSF